MRTRSGPSRRLIAALSLAAALLAAYPTRASTDEAADFVRTLGDTALLLLRDGTPDPAARRDHVEQLLARDFDLAGMGRLSLGRFWRVATETQRGEFLRLFAAFVTNLYANNLDRRPGDPPLVTDFAVDRVRAEPEADGAAQTYVVTTHFERPAGPPVRVEWRVRAEEGDYRVADLSVQGLSMVVIFRQMLATALREGGGDVEGLLGRLR
ncbi:MAG: ABC transporter substrate-binding protein, partial [Rhodospirillaceae bacterium]|nr:ABC transporter substrate-binding protein [Rhodospirillaceae bacterium]